MIRIKNHHIFIIEVQVFVFMGNISKVTLGVFKWVEETYAFDEYFIKSYNEDSDIRYFIEVDVQNSKNYITFKMIYHFYRKQ